MKQYLLKSLGFIFIFLLGMQAEAQIVVTVGTGTTQNTALSYPTPYGNYWWGVRSQYLVRASELIAAGATPGFMSSVGFEVATIQGVGLNDFYVNVGTTTDSIMSTASFYTGTTQVFSATSYTEVAGWNTHAFSQNFFWNGTDNIVIEVCFNNTSFTQNALVFNTDVGYTSSIWYNADQAGVCTNTSPFISSSNSRPNMRFSFLPNTGRDLGTVQLISPQPLALGTNQVTARFTSLAADPIISADIAYQLNNDPPVTVTGHSFANPLTAGQGENVTFITPLNITANGTYTLKVWNSNANGLGADNNTSNDTLVRTLCTSLGGSYTVGGSLADYATIGDAVAALRNCGINSPVTFLINDGTYYGGYELANIIGAGGTNTINFISASGNPANVVLIQDTLTPVAGARHHFRINGITNVSFNSMTFRRTLDGTAISAAILFDNAADFGTVSNCVFDDQTGGGGFNGYGIRINTSSYISILNNTFTNFYYTVYLNGATANSTYSEGIQVIANTFIGYRYAVYLINSSTASISGNQFQGINNSATFGYGIYLSRAAAATVSENAITGKLGNAGIYMFNMNSDSLGAQNRIYNNVISGTADASTTIITYGIYYGASTSTSTTITPLNPIDQLSIVNNTINIAHSSTSTSNFGGIHLTGGSATTPALGFGELLNNNVFLYPATGAALPSNVSPLWVTGAFLRDSLTSNYNNFRIANATGGAALNPVVRERTTPYATIADWTTASSRDANSVSVTPDFIAPTLPIPTSLALDNLGTPTSYIFTDIAGNPRSATTPDIGAYEFTGLQFSQITLTPLTDTLVSTGRSIVVNIQDSTGLVTGPPNGPRLYYSKNSTGVWEVDSTPVVTGNDFTFSINYTALGGVLALDTINYYVATLNNGGTVTTSPLGGSGTGPIGNVVPPIVYNYKLLGQAAGTYRVGVSGQADFPTVRSAVNFLANSLITGPVTFVLIDTLYDAASGETFPYSIAPTAGLSATNNIKIRLDSSVTSSMIIGNNASAIFVLDGMKHFEIDGANVAGGRGLTVINNSVAANSAVVYMRNTLLNGNEFVTLQNMHIVGGSSTVTSTFGITGQGTAVSTFGSGDRMSDITIRNVGIERAYYGIFVRGTLANPAVRLRIENNTIGSLDTNRFVIFRGVDVQNAPAVRITGNTIFNLVSATATSQAGIEVGGTPTDSARIERNIVWGVKNLNSGGWGAWGINILSGTNAFVVNNVVYDLRTVNYSNTSTTFNAFGIRLAGGTGHKVHYNSVNLFGTYTQPGTFTDAASAAAFCVSSTVVSGIDVRNNVFNISSTSTGVLQSSFVAIWMPSGYSYAANTINNNAYHVDTTSQHYVGRVGTAATGPFYTTVLDWKAVTSAGNPTNDGFSVPPVGRSLAPFVSNTNLTVAAGTTTGIESGGVVIPVLGTPNTDFNGVNRPAGTGTAPDLGAFEIDGVALPDQFPPTVDSFTITPRADQCVVTPRTVTVYASDNLGGSGIDSVMMFWSIDTVAQAPILMTRTSGNAASGVYTGTLPGGTAAGQSVRAQVMARDSLANFAPAILLGTFKDDYILISAGNDTTIVAGDTATLIASSAFGQAGFLGDPTLAATTNCGGGFMFDMTAVGGSLFISGFDLLPNNTGSQTVTVFYKAGGVAGAQANQAAWTQEGAYTINPTNNTSPFNLAINGFTIPAGTVVGVYLQYHSRYSSSGSTNLSNSELTITNGEGLCTNWTPCCSPRNWVGRVYYGSPVTFSWTEQGTTTVLGTSDTLKVTPVVTTNYVLTATDSTCTKTDTVTVFVNPNVTDDIGISAILTPTAVPALSSPYTVTVVIENFGTTPATGFDVAFAVNGSELNANAIARTVPAGDTIHHTFTQAWTPTVGGTVELCAYTKGLATDVNAANDTSCATFLNVNVEEVNNLVSKVYPVPADQFVNFDFGAQQGAGKLELRDNLGRVVYSTWVDLSNGSKHEVKTSSYAAGVYNYRFVMDDKVQYGQVVVRR